MIKVGLTGTIGSGKSIIAAIFVKLGVPVYVADQQAREILQKAEVKLKLRALLGSEIFDESGDVQRSTLAEKVFHNPADLETLNNLIHPLVKTDFDAWLNDHTSSPYIIHEAAILFESGFSHYFDKVIVVDAPEELCISRVMKRDNATREMVVGRMQHQWEREQKVALADYIIVNDGKSMVLPQVLALHAILKELATKP
jgi:dephospho-CoA kinase